MKLKWYVHPEFGPCMTKSARSMPMKFSELSGYNERVAEGVVHTDEYADRMKVLQAEYDRWARET